MIIHFICRGNSFRSIIAEAYLNSLTIKDSSVLSSGTTAASDKSGNLVYYRMTLELLEKHGIRGFAKAGYGDQLTQPRIEKADITVCMNQRVYGECLRSVTFPASPHVWSVADVGEPGRVAYTESESRRYREEAYQEIVSNVNRLISDIPAARLSTLAAGNAGKLSHRHRVKRHGPEGTLRFAAHGYEVRPPVRDWSSTWCATRAREHSARSMLVGQRSTVS